MNLVRKYLNYIIFAAVVLVVVGIAVSHSRGVHALVENMGNADPAVRSKSALELIQTEQFSDSITGESIRTRLNAIKALESLADDKSVVKGSGKDDLDYRSQAVKQCIALLKDTDRPVREAAVAALKRMDYTAPDNLKELVNGIGDGDPGVRKGVAATFVAPDGLGPRADVVAAIIDKMKGDGGTRGPGGDILGSARFLKEGARALATPALLTILTARDDKDPRKFKNDEGARSGAADALGKLGDPAAVAPLIGAMKGDSPAVRRVAIGAIALIADPSGEQALIDSVNNSATDNEARLQAAAGLGKIGSPQAIATLIHALSDTDLKLRSATVAALARAGRPTADGPVNHQVLSELIAALGSADDDARLGSAQSLAKLGAPEANGALTGALRNGKEPELRAAAASALGFAHNIGGVQPLIAALSDPDGDVREAARDGLSAIGIEATPALIGAMERGQTDAFYATEAIAHLGSAALPALQRAAQDASHPVGQRWAAVALGELGVADATPTLQQLARSSDPDVSFVAKSQLDRLGAAE